jgi:hypothetical protein
VHLEEMELAQLLLHFLMEHQGQRASEVIWLILLCNNSIKSLKEQMKSFSPQAALWTYERIYKHLLLAYLNVVF